MIELNVDKKSGILTFGLFEDFAIVLKNVTTVTMGREVHQFSDTDHTVMVDGVVVYESNDWYRARDVKNQILRVLRDYHQ